MRMIARRNGPAPLTKHSDRQRLRAGWPYRAEIALRTLAGTAGAYLIAVLAGMVLARILPMARAEAVLTATMLAFVVGPAVTIWAFLARGPWRATGGVVLAAVLLAGLLRLTGGPA
jgi:hypothetical protein